MLSHVLIALGLSADSFSVSLARGTTENRRSLLLPASQIALVFGVFQGGLMALGYLSGSLIADFMQRYGTWIAAALLFGVGIKMILDAIRSRNEDEPRSWKLPLLLLLGVATAIDAFAVGIAYQALSRPIIAPALIVASICAAASFAGVYLGRVARGWLGRYAEIGGGVVLIGLGVKTLLEGLVRA